MKEIDRLLLEEKSIETKKLLKKLKHLSNDGFLFMMGEYQLFGPKYHALQYTPIWKEAKQVFIQYLINKKQFKCPICNTTLNFQRCTMHHAKYKPLELFCPTFLQILHNGCHSDFHQKK